MSSKEINISEIEAYFEGKLDAGQQQALEERLKTDTEFTAAFQDYNLLLDGLKVNQQDYFKSQLETWSSSWASIDEEQIQQIQWYVMGNLSENGKLQFEAQMAQDEALAQKVSAYRKIIDGLHTERDQRFRQLMENWSQRHQTQPAAKVRRLSVSAKWIIAAAAIVLLLGIGLNWYAQNSFSNEALFSAHYKPWLKENVMGPEQLRQNAIAQELEKAHQLLENQSYREAEQAFQQILTQIPNASLDNFNSRYFEENASWNLLLAQLGQDKLNPAFFERLSAIATQNGHTYQASAEALQSKLNSWMYQIIE